MCNVDWETLEWALSQNDLQLSYSFAQTMGPGESSENVPFEAGFFWKRNGQQVWSLKLTREKLPDVFAKLESKKLAVPTAFREALQEFPK